MLLVFVSPASYTNHNWAGRAMASRLIQVKNKPELEIKMRKKGTTGSYLLSPMSLIADAGGPINVKPSSSQSWANPALSDKKP